MLKRVAGDTSTLGVQADPGAEPSPASRESQHEDGDVFRRQERHASRLLPRACADSRRKRARGHSSADVLALQNRAARSNRSKHAENEAVRDAALTELLGLMFTPHPIHGIEAGDASNVTAYIEITPGTTVKNEVWKKAGRLGIDRPQPYSSACPALYGLVPQTFCGERLAEMCMRATGKEGIKGDGDPLDILVLTDNGAVPGDLLAHARVIGGLRMIDGNEADDKLIAVLIKDATYGHLTDIGQLKDAMPGLIDKMRHYFLTYKQGPGEVANRVEIAEVYGAEVAAGVLEATKDDYVERFGAPKNRVSQLRKLILGIE